MEQPESNNKESSFDKNNAIFHEIKHLFIDYYCASGTLPTLSNLQALIDRGFLSHSIQEVLTACECENLNDLQILMKSFITDYSDEQASKRAQIIDEIKELRSQGVLPEIFFKQFERALSDESSIDIFNNPGTRIPKDLAVFSDEDVPYDDDELIRRYGRLLIARDAISGSRASENKLDFENRIISIGLGVNIENRRVLLHSFSHQLTASAKGLDAGEIELEAMQRHMFDYIYPQYRNGYLRDLLRATKTPPINTDYGVGIKGFEYFYLLDDAIVLLVGKTAINAFFKDRKYLDRLQREKKILTGKSAAETYLKHLGAPQLERLGLLLHGDMPLPDHSQMRSYGRDLTRSRLIAYLRWLISIRENMNEKAKDPKKKTLSEEVLKRAYSLGIGPSYHETARRTFKSMTEVYKTLGLDDSHRVGEFEDWTEEDYINYLQEVAQGLGRTPSIAELIAAAREDRTRPTPYRIIGVFDGISNAYVAAGFSTNAKGAAISPSFISKK